MKQFLTKNYVFITGLLAALTLFLEQALVAGPVDLKVIGTGALMAIIGYVANTWKKGGLTVTGILGSLAVVFVQLKTTGTVDWTTFSLLAILKVLTAASSALDAYKPKE